MPFLHKIICSAWNKTNALLGFSLICYSSNYLDNTTFWNAKLGLSNPSLVKCGDHVIQRWARIRTGSDWIRTETNFGLIRTGSDCNFFENWWIRTGSDWKNIFFARIAPQINVIILNVSKILVVIRFYRFAKWQCNFAINGKNSAETILPFELYPPLPTYLTLHSSSNVNLVEWLMPMPVLRVFVGSAITISFDLAWRDYSFDGNAFYVGYFFKTFEV